MSSIIQSLKDEGVLKLYSDFRSGTYDDFSGNSHDATPTGTILKKESSGYALEMVNGTVGAQYTTIANHADHSFGTTTDYSIYVWCQSRADSTASVRVVSNAQITPSTGGIAMDITSGKPRVFHQAAAAGDYVLTADSAVVSTDSHHYCMTCDRDSEGLMYVDGLNVAATEVEPGARGDTVDSSGALQFGRVLAQTNLNFDGVMYVVLLVNRVLTATEVSQIYAELNNTKYPLKSLAKGKNVQAPDLDDSNLIAAWNMKPQNNILPDLSGNGKDCTIVGASHQTSLLGDALAFDGVTDHLTTTYTVNNDNAFTTSVWVKTTDTDALNYIYGYYDAPKYWTLYTNATGNVLARIGQGSGGSLLTATSTGSINDGLWHNVMSIWDGVNTVTIYIDGVADGTATGAVSTFFAALTPRIAAFNHSATGTGNYLNCEMSNFEIYNEAKDATWVTEKYEKGARAVQYKTDWGVDVNVADVTSGEIDNTNWQVNTGTWQVATDTIDGVKCKVLKCTTNNSLMYMNAGAVDIDNAENMYGTWEFYLYKGNGANAIHVSIKDEINLPGAGTANGYIFRMGASERFRLRKETAGTVSDLMTTDASFFNIDQWYKFKITRSNRGVFTVYIDNTLLAVAGGTNPVTDNTFTTAPYILIDMDNLDMIALADVSGNHSLTKHLGVI